MTVEIPNIRRECDVRMYTTLKDNGVVVDWSTVENVRAFLFNESKRIITGECLVSADPDDDQVLVVDYLASSSQELGVNRLVIRVTYHDRVKTYDKLALNFVSITALATGMTILEDPTFAVEVDAPEEFVPTVGIDVAEVSTSVLDAAIDAAIAAAKEAEEAAREARDAAEAAMEAIADCPTREEYDAHLAGKVDKEDGKGLSSNDYTDEDKAAVEGIPSALKAKQDVLVSGETIKTINGESILGEGNIEIQGKGGFEPTDEQRDAMDSGINADKVSQYDAYATSKQDTIADLAAIREGASKGETALQSVPSTYRTASEQDVIDAGKQDTIDDLGTIRRNSANAVYVSTEDFCGDSLGDVSVINVENEATILPSRLSSTEGWLYDYQEGWRVVPDFGTWLSEQGGWNDITWGDLLAHFDEISTPIGEGGSGFEPTTDQLAAMNSGITSTKVTKYDGYASGKQDKINDLVTIRSNAAKAATSVQTSGDQRIEGQKVFTDLRVVEDDGETIFFEPGYDADSDLLRLNLNDTYDGESVILGHVADPVLDYDAVNKQTLEKTIADNTVTTKDAEGEGVPSLPFITDAPADGKQYARQNGGWTEVIGGESGEWKTVCENYQLAVGSKKFVFTQCADGTPIDADEAICMIKYGQSSAAHNGYFAIYNDAGEKCSFGAIVYENTAPNGRYNVLHAKKHGEMYLYQMFPNVDYAIANSAATNTGLGNYKFTTRFTQIAAEPNYVIDGETYINIYVKNK